MGVTQPEVQAAVEKLCKNLSPKGQKMVEEAVLKNINEKVSTKETLGFTPSMLEELYKLAHTQFRAGRYQDALKLFDFLYRLDPLDYRFVFGIAACHQYLKHYQEAAGYYIICQHIDPLNPIPRFHLYDCFMKLDMLVPALRAVEETIAFAKLNVRYKELEERASLESQHLQRILPAYLKEHFEPKKTPLVKSTG